MPTTSKINPNHHHYHDDSQQRMNSSSKRTIINNIDQLIDKAHQASARSAKLKSYRDRSKVDSGSDDLYTAPLNNDELKISSSATQKQRIGQEDDPDEQSTSIRAIMTKTKRQHHVSIPSNNSAMRLQQQAMGDHYHSNPKQHKSRRYHQDLDKDHIYRWRLFMYILTLITLIFVIYRFLIAIWPKSKKTFMEQLIDDISNFFTP